MKFLLSNKILDPQKAKDFNNLKLRNLGLWSLLINDTESITESSNELVITDGYLRDTNFEDLVDQKLSAGRIILNDWPVPNNITGSFSSVILNKKTNDFVLATDLANIYPLYYLIKGDEIYISNSIILTGRYSNVKLDKTGIFQRAVGPNFINIGSRTILEGCKSLLPGEWRKYKSIGSLEDNKFDNSLFQEIGAITLNEFDVKKYWKSYKNEVELCLQNYENVNIALSGGIDSRIALGAIPEGKFLNSKTFGNPKNYESRIASKLSRIKGSKQKFYYDPYQYFPTKEVFYNYALNTESLKLNSWLEVLENINENNKQPIILGELCEALPGRNLKKFSTGKFRYKNFFSIYIKKADFKFTNADERSFNHWKESKTKNLLSWHDNNWFEKLNFGCDKEKIVENSIEDLNGIFKRIEDHNLPYIELYDELFSWYTFTRKELSRQVTICNENFYAFSPAMSLQMLKMTSNIHPNHRLFYRFIDKLFSTIPELKKLSQVPTSQIPLVPQSSSNLFKIPIWGLRSKIDDFLVQRLMKSKNIKKRYRVFESTNWAKIYHQKDMITNLKSYYENNYLSEEYYKTFHQLAEKRKTFESWPFANMDIISGASLNAEIDLIKNPPKIT